MRWSIIGLLLFLISISYSAGYDFAWAIVPGALIFSTLLIAFAIMLGDALSMPHAKSWAKIELRELIAGALLIAIISSSFFITNEGAKILTGEQNVIKAAQKTTFHALNNITAAYRTDILLSSRLTSMASYTYRVSLPVWFFGFSYTNANWNGFGALLAAPSIAAQGLANALYIYAALNTFLKFFDAVVPLYILPLGFALRVIPFTRKVGNTVIALAIGAYVIFPFSLILVGYLHSVITYPDPTISSSALGKISLVLSAADGMKFMCQSEAFRIFMGLGELGWWLIIGIPASIPCLTGFLGCLYSWYEIITKVVYPIVAVLGQIIFSAILVGGSLDAASNMDPEKVYAVTSAALKPINYVVVITYVDALIIAITTYIGTKSVSSAIGGEAYMVGLQRLM